MIIRGPICVVVLLIAILCSDSSSSEQPNPEPQAIEAPIPAVNETLDSFIRRWNAFVDSIPEDQRAGELLIENAERMDSKIRSFSNEEDCFWVYNLLDDVHPRNPDWKHAHQLFASIGPELDEARVLLKRPWLGMRIEPAEKRPWDLPGEEDWVAVSDWNIRSGRGANDVSRVFLSHVKYLGYTGHARLAAEELLYVGDAAELMSESWLMGWLMAQGTRTMTLSTIFDMLDDDIWTMRSDGLEGLQGMVYSWLDDDFSEALTKEQYMSRAYQRVLFQGHEDGMIGSAQRETVSESLRFSFFFMNDDQKRKLNSYRIRDPEYKLAPLEEQLEFIDEMFKAFNSDIEQSPATAHELASVALVTDLLNQENGDRLYPAMLMLQAQSSLLRTRRVVESEYRATIILLAIYRHKDLTSAWPQSLGNLLPRLLPISLIDPLSGLEYGYTLVDGRPKLWSAGPDRDDDGGKVIPPASDETKWSVANRHSYLTLNEWNQLSDEERQSMDGDRIIFPPEPNSMEE